ncbi:CAP-gly domain linker [Quillaja saponaria]|uniref:CAP-gly domain linker n=1 Tax=Quillaja saponaria TaxID=32244 RepID=A0AAD7PIW5_QUISA|nr:CAP-gly domain linker [Quillaja saponaria]
MEDSGAIICHISSLKDMLDQVNEEIEANIQITREIESGIVKCTEIETGLAARESELTKMLYMLQFEIDGLVTFTADTKASINSLEKELCYLRMKRDEILKRMSLKREGFITQCIQFQEDIDKRENGEAGALLLEKEFLETEIYLLNKKNDSLKNSVFAFVQEILEDLHRSNSALECHIQRAKWEKEILLKDINDLKTTLISAIGTDNGQFIN